MLFKNFIYLNENLLSKLAKQLDISISYEYTSTNQTAQKASLNFKSISAGQEKMKTNTKILKEDKYDLFKVFEQKISEDETGIVEFDFKEAEHILAGQLIKFSAIMKQPKGKQEDIELLSSIKQNPIFSQLINETIEKESVDNSKLLNMIFNTPNNIPVYFSNEENYIVLSNLNNDYLDISYEEFQYLYDEEIKVILLTDRKYTDNQEVILMDVMKDIFKIGRDLRRTMSIEEQNKYIIKEKGPAIKGEVLAIYS